MTLKACPFCGGEGERVELSDPGNEGGTCIACKRCGACTAVYFDRKENLESSWNDRAVTDDMVKRALQGFDTGTGDPNDYRRRMRAALEAALNPSP
jgi:Lar family restriction alleviation protein